MNKTIYKIMTLLSSFALLVASSTVNSSCSIWIYEEKMPEKALKLVKK